MLALNRHGLLASCVVAVAALVPVSQAHAAEDVVFQLDWLPGGDKAIAFLGVQAGMFAEEDINVTILPGRGSSDAITKVATGVADIGVGGLGALMSAKAEGEVPVTAVMAIYTKQPDAIFTTPESGIEGLNDLVGKRVATAPFSSSNATWPVLLSSQDIDPESVELLKMEPAALAPMLASGQIDATINWLPVAPVAEATVAQAGKELKVMPWSEYGFDGYSLAMFVNDGFLEENPEVVANFVAAFERALDASQEDPAAAAEALKAMVPETDVGIAQAQLEASMPLIFNEVQEADGLGTFTPERLEETWNWVAQSQGYDKDAIDLEALTTVPGEG